jgi:hypothetical protein
MQKTLTSPPAQIEAGQLPMLALLLLFDSMHFIFARLLLPYVSPNVSAMYVMIVATIQVGIYGVVTRQLGLAALRNHWRFFLIIGLLIGIRYHSTKWWRIKDEFSGVCHGVLGVQKAAVGSERITIREQTSNDRSARWPWPAFVVANVGDGVGQSWVGAGNDGKYRSYKWSPRETWLYAKSPDVWPHGDCAESGSPGVRERLR